eukprot:4016382-Lingulodinium_polyedra.AAC.1
MFECCAHAAGMLFDCRLNSVWLPFENCLGTALGANLGAASGATARYNVQTTVGTAWGLLGNGLGTA